VAEMKTILRLCLVTCVLALVGSTAYAQQVNPNNLPPCPKPDMSKKTDIEGYAKWTNCWGRYKVETDSISKGTIYEGEFKNGTPHGFGTFIFPNVGRYTGQLVDGHQEGYGTFTDAQGNEYVGDFKNGHPHGNGSVLENNGGKYMGTYIDGKRHGRGTYTYPNGDKYVGEFKNGVHEGQGTFTNSKGKIVGEFRDGLPNGQGSIFVSDGTQYSGELKNGNRHGLGTLIMADGGRYVGEWKEDKRDGKGTMTYPSGVKYVGDWKLDKKNGEGTLTTAEGGKYFGEWKDGKEHGFGKTYFSGGGVYLGQYDEGKRHGQGIYTAENGKRVEGIWEKDQLVRETKVNLSLYAGNFEVTGNESRDQVARHTSQMTDRELGQSGGGKLQIEKQRNSQRMSLQISTSKVTDDGSFSIDIKTNVDTSSLKINGEELGGREDGVYRVHRVARAGGDTKISIVAKDVYGNTETRSELAPEKWIP